MFSSLAAKRAQPLPNVVRPPRVVPRSLFSRSLLIVILPLLILQAVLTYIFYERHWDKVTRTLAYGVAGEVGLLVELLEAAKTPETQARVLDLARKHFDFAISLEPGADLSAAAQSSGLTVAGAAGSEAAGPLPRSARASVRDRHPDDR